MTYFYFQIFVFTDHYFTSCDFFFLHQRKRVGFDWSRIDRKIPRVSQNSSGRNQQYCNLDSLNWSSDFHCFQGIFQLHQLQLVSTSFSYSTPFFVLPQCPSTCLSFHCLWFSANGPIGREGHLFLLIITRSRLLARIMWSICISESLRILCVSFSWTDSGFCIYHLVVWSKFFI